MHVIHCRFCGQTVADDRDPHLIVESRSAITCDACREALRQPQGEPVRLFSPAPTQIPGQTSMGLDG